MIVSSVSLEIFPLFIDTIDWYRNDLKAIWGEIYEQSSYKPRGDPYCYNKKVVQFASLFSVFLFGTKMYLMYLKMYFLGQNVVIFPKIFSIYVIFKIK